MRKVFAVILALVIIAILLIGVSELPEFGRADNPANNYVYQRYLDNGAHETGALNIVTAIILEYRAFDTFVEATVLFAAIICVITVLKSEGD